MSTPRTALFPGTFDPFTNGHLDLTRRAARLFDRVVVAVADSTAKGTLFTLEERAEMIRNSVKGLGRVEVVTFRDLVVECARREGAMVLIRGLRAVSEIARLGGNITGLVPKGVEQRLRAKLRATAGPSVAASAARDAASPPARLGPRPTRVHGRKKK
jgi:cytidyltransferase-like protein